MAGVRNLLLTRLACFDGWRPCLILLAAQIPPPQLHIMLAALHHITSCLILHQDQTYPASKS